jgi:predicted Zn-dependent protease
MISLLRALVVAACAPLLVIGCETAPLTGRSQIMLLDAGQERTLGLQAYQQVMSQERLSNNGNIKAMVERVGRRIAAAAENPPNNLWRPPGFDWEFKVVDKNIPNAFCMPGGKVAVYTGLLPIAQSEAGLAVVMGHEVAHALARHGAERISDNMVVQLGAAAAGIAIASTAGGRNRAYTPMIIGALGAGATLGYVLPMSRTQESEADRIGLVLMAMAGYDPHEGVGLWQRMAAAKGNQPRQSEWLSTHPADETRIENIRGWIPEAMKYYRGGD